MRFYQLLWASLTQLSYPSSLGLMGFPSAPYFLYLHYFRLAIAHSYFSSSHIAYGFATSLSSGSFRPIWFLKAHLFISWVCDPLFLSLGLNGFSIHLPTLFCLRCQASPFHLDFQNGHQHLLTVFLFCVLFFMLKVGFNL